MQNVMTADVKEKCSWNGAADNSVNSIWILSLFGTAIGAGILFLPITAGLMGFIPLLCLTLLLAPATYLAHYFLTEFILTSKLSQAQLTTTVAEHFGERFGRIFNWLFFFSIFPILLIYGIGLTNTINNLMINQLGYPPCPRWLLSLGISSVLSLIILFGSQLMLRVCTWVTYPLIIFMFGISVYLIPHWNASTFFSEMAITPSIKNMWLFLPLFIFSFNHSPAISKFASAMKNHYQSDALRKSRFVLLTSNTIMQFFVLFFVVSCILALTPSEMLLAKQQNISVLSFFANKLNLPFFTLIGSFVALTAIFSSFLGHYFGAFEGLKSIVATTVCPRYSQVQPKRVNGLIHLMIFLSVWTVSTLNPNILTMISTLCGPFIAFILFILPSIALLKFSQNNPTKKRLLVFSLGIGMLTALTSMTYLMN